MTIMVELSQASYNMMVAAVKQAYAEERKDSGTAEGLKRVLLELEEWDASYWGED